MTILKMCKKAKICVRKLNRRQRGQRDLTTPCTFQEKYIIHKHTFQEKYIVHKQNYESFDDTLYAPEKIKNTQN